MRKRKKQLTFYAVGVYDDNSMQIMIKNGGKENEKNFY